MTEDATEQHLEDEEEDATEQHLEDEDEDPPDLHLETKDEMEDARSQDEDVKDEDATPKYVTPGTTKVKRSVIRRPRLTARKRVREFWKREVEGQTER